ncbi:universal stress protein [Luteibacter sp. CQ10]|uniref:universal stress protein n=1 Tax=Luteibacter sp. CQ10 TaxID=2805821 RepID=UPI0034A5BC83
MDILVDIRASERDTTHVRVAFELAKRFDAHLTGLQIVDLDASLVVLPEPLLVLEDEENAARRKREWWMDTCRNRKVGGEWEVRRGSHRRALVRRASLADLVVGRLESMSVGMPLGTAMLARALMARVTPIVLVPDGAAITPMERILVAWNGSSVSLRAIRNALAFLRSARHVTILAGDPGSRSRKEADPWLRAWLERHAIVYTWVDMDDDDQPSQAMRTHARQTHADAVVMGAWGRSRLRELALGGTTRQMLSHDDLSLILSA